MKNAVSAILPSALVCILACQPSTNGTAPTPPEQKVVKEYGAVEAEVDAAREKLTKLHNKLKDSLQTWRDTPAPAGPQFEGEEDALAKEILADCEALQQDATKLSEQPYIREYEGAGADLQEMIQFAENTRWEVQKGRQVRQEP